MTPLSLSVKEAASDARRLVEEKAPHCTGRPSLPQARARARDPTGDQSKGYKAGGRVRDETGERRGRRVVAGALQRRLGQPTNKTQSAHPIVLKSRAPPPRQA
eukprot:5046938-Pleurochrysis_carterae.AAC.2